jgi:hypothetical protein
LSFAAVSVASLSTASGSAPSYSARAWVNFDGTGTPAIRASGNVSSITDNGTGDYTVNFTTALPDTDYSPVFGGARQTLSYNSAVYINNTNSTYTTTALRLTVVQLNDVPVDIPNINAAIFR